MLACYPKKIPKDTQLHDLFASMTIKAHTRRRCFERIEAEHSWRILLIETHETFWQLQQQKMTFLNKHIFILRRFSSDSSWTAWSGRWRRRRRPRCGPGGCSCCLGICSGGEKIKNNCIWFEQSVFIPRDQREDYGGSQDLQRSGEKAFFWRNRGK